jgi:coenzyme F420-reducing hydrogenase beta subunit
MKAAAKCLQAGPAYVAFEGSPAEAKLASDAELQAALLDAAPALRDIIIGAFCTDSVNNSRLVTSQNTHSIS